MNLYDLLMELASRGFGMSRSLNETQLYLELPLMPTDRLTSMCFFFAEYSSH